MDGRLTCAVVTPFESLYSETFIRDQIERLPFEVLPVYGIGREAKYGGVFIGSKFARFVCSGLVHRMPGSVERWAATSLQESLARFWKRHGVRVILAQFATAGADVLASATRAGVPVVVHCHGYDVYESATLERMRAPYQRLFAHAAAFISVSSDMDIELRNLGAPAERIHRIPVGVDTEFFPMTDPALNPPIVLAVGRFVEKKAPWATILAFREALERCPDARLILVGDGPLVLMCKDLVRALGISSAVEFAGVQAPEKIRQLMQGARALAQHSIRALNGDSEGSPVVVLEAASSGLPVIATRHAGIKDTMVHGSTALLCDELDISAMAANLASVLRNPQLARELGRNGRQRVMEQFSVNQSIPKLAAVLRNAMRDGRVKV